jgi:GT2 family glycosyltransferase
MNRLLERFGIRLSDRHWILLLFIPFDFLVTLILIIGDALYWPFSRSIARKPSLEKPHLERVSIIVLNWDGRQLLEEFLPSVLEAVRHDGRDHEVIVVDNGSRDDSIQMLRTRFPSVKVVALDRNMRFTGGNNAGVKEAKNDIVIFLNNDMAVDPGFIRPLLEAFRNDDVFAVSCQVFFQDKSRRREETGNTKARWRFAFVDQYHGDVNHVRPGGCGSLIFWAGGGSSAFDRNKFLEIGGLDSLYDPFYLEDVDLSYQAWKRGWKTLFAADSIVVHKHRGTNKQRYGDKFVDNTIRKNQYLFIWKNITDFRWIVTHGLCLPLNQARFLSQSSCLFETCAFFRALCQFPEALAKRYRRRAQYSRCDSEIFHMTSGP